MRVFATTASAWVWRRSSWAHACILLLLSRNSFPVVLPYMHPLTSLPFWLPSFETLTHRAGFFRGNGKIPVPPCLNPSKAPNAMTSSSLAAKVPLALSLSL